MAAKVQVGELKAPVELLERPMLPVGVVIVPTSVSVTVAVQFVEVLLATVLGVQLTEVEVTRLFTVTIVLPPLPLWFVSPL